MDKLMNIIDDALEDMGQTHRQRLIFVGRLSGNSMQSIGQHMGITRERVRQIFNVTAGKFVQKAPDLPEYILGNINSSVCKITDELILANNMLEIFGRGKALSVVGQLAVPVDKLEVFNEHVSNITGDRSTLAEITETDYIDIDLLVGHITGLSDNNQLFEYNNHLYLWRPNRDCSIKIKTRKVLFITGDCSINALHQRIFRKKQDGVIPFDLFRALFKHGSGVPSWGFTLKKEVVHPLEEFGVSPLSQAETIVLNEFMKHNHTFITNERTMELMLENNLSKATAAAILRYSPIIEKAERDNYVLID